MNTVNNIIVPVDFGENTKKLVDFAVDMAAKFSAQVHFIHVSSAHQGYDMMLGITSFKKVEKGLMEASEEKMQNLVADYAAQCAGCSGKVVSGDIVDEIIAYTTAEKGDLLVVATHGSKGLEKILLGSIAERVIKRAPCPVLSLNPYK